MASINYFPAHEPKSEYQCSVNARTISQNDKSETTEHTPEITTVKNPVFSSGQQRLNAGKALEFEDD